MKHLLLPGISLLAFALPVAAQSGLEPPIPRGHSFSGGDYELWEQGQHGVEPPIPRPTGRGGWFEGGAAGWTLWEGGQGAPGSPSDDLGTLPNSSAQPGTTRTESGAVNVQPCSVEENGGSSAANQCGSEGNITIKNNGDVNVADGVTGVVATGSRTDTVKVGDECGVAVVGPASPVKIDGHSSTVSVTNTHPFANMPVTVGLNGPKVYVAPGATQTFITTAAPGV